MILIAINTYFQAFCIPTTWTLIVLIICFANTILYPLLQTTKLAPFTNFINGVSFFIFIYFVLFLEHINIYGLFSIIAGIGLVVFIPHFFVLQLIWKNVFRPAIQTSRYYFLIAFICCIITAIGIGYSYKKAIHSIEVFKSSNYTELERNYMTEKILGMHFIYHTRICEFDGWRPPKHDPALVIGMWLNSRYDPLKVDLNTRLLLYKKFFPNNPYKFDCSCGIEYNEDYHNDPLWKN